MDNKGLDFNKTVIYKIICKDILITDCFVGRTINFKNRKQSHKIACINKPNLKIYKFINEHGGWTNWDMIEIETCKTKEEAIKKELEWFDKLKPTLNNNIPIKDKTMWQRYNKKKWQNMQEIIII